MENSSKALYMAGSLLIALLVVSLLVYTFNNLGGVQKEKDKIEMEEDIIKFNREYEAFNKKLMYGVDVISCINKAVSNNEKYVKEGKWAAGGASSDEATVQIVVKIDSPLKESIQVFRLNDKQKETKIYSDQSGKIQKYLQNQNVSVKEYFKVKNNILSGIIDEKISSSRFDDLQNNFFQEFSEGNKKFKTEMYLLDEAGSKNNKYTKFDESNTSLYNLTYYANNTEFVVFNDKAEDDSWYSIKWTTYLSDFKSRKFTCTNVNYNDATGRIDKLEFSEY